MNKTMFLLHSLLIVIFKIVARIEANVILEKGVTAKDRKIILDAHNELRLKLANGQVPNQPRATNMNRLCWDKSLAEEAQKIAQLMRYEHVPVEDDRWMHVGQNLAKQTSTVHNPCKDWKSVVNRWFNEVKYYTYGKQHIRGTGHYTQVAWAKTTHVGCGYIFFIDNRELLKFRKLYVCNYGPGGNIDGVPPYKTGQCGCIGLCKTDCNCT
ncbi:hypothetical protein ILUMI_25627 [Ignelater luminosus]|uniref:SCP domain-containing protein n=1 Tax=Ignelater luminosus TaxID=2038154 RepID=A0A8K0C843_IGNLU|nr:hypothetical protein ILUMI_25627 [Ignelater luminosus]